MWEKKKEDGLVSVRVVVGLVGRYAGAASVLVLVVIQHDTGWEAAQT